MEEKKVLTIDTMICDLRTVSEETLQSYEKIYISAMTVFITERTQELFHRYPVDLDAMAVEKLDENVRLVEQNGVYKITDQEPAGDPTYLTVSGQLQIAKGAEKALESYVKIVVNGKAIYPKSIEKALVGKLTCNGAMTVYPDDAIFVEKELIADNKVLETKAAQEARFAKFAKDNNRADYAKVVGEIDAIIEKSNPVLYQFTCFNEILRSGIEFGTPYIVMDSLKVAVKNKDKAGIKKYTDMMKSVYESVHNKDYDHEVDRKVAKALLPLYAEMVEADALPSFYQTIQNDFKGNYDAYIDNLYDNSIFSNEKNFNKFISKPNVKALEKDPMYAFVKSKYALGDKLVKELSTALNGLELLHKTYVRGLCEMYSPEPKAPDANFTIRLTYGNVKSYNPKDGIHYKYYTTLKGVMEKEDPTNPEFVVPAKLKELYTAKDFGRYALPNGEMPACFLTTNDITGGNSGSPVINGSGELIGTAFDGNWESLSGDINFDNNLQRCIAVDIRYVLFIIDKLGGCGHLIDEMTIVE